MPPTLTYPYRRNSTLPRREWVVNVTVHLEGLRQLDVIAPDFIEAEDAVRRFIRDNFPRVSYSIDMVREIVRDTYLDCVYSEDGRSHWYRTVNRVTVRVPDFYASRINAEVVA